MEIYTFESDKLTIEDRDLAITLTDTFAPTYIPSDPKKELILPNHSQLKLIFRDDDTLEQAYIEKEGMRNGQSLIYYPSGKKKMESFYKNNTLHGPSTFYKETGEVLAKGWFFNGLRQGKCMGYFPSGSVCSLQRFKDGAWHGKQEYFYEDGKPKTIMHYANGLLDGKVLIYAQDGTIERDLDYKKGEKISV